MTKKNLYPRNADKVFYAAHRKALMARLSDGLILLSGGKNIVRNNDIHYPFRQDSNFLYVTGIEEPGCHLLLDPRRRTQTLFIPRIDTKHLVWLGRVPGLSESRRLYGISQVRYADELEKALKEAKKGYRLVYANANARKEAKKSLKGLKDVGEELEDVFAEFRAVKDSGEVALIKRASEVTGRAHLAVMAAAKPGMREYELQAVFDSECVKGGLKHLSYPTIVAAGRNAAVLHYWKNTSTIRKGDLVLVDAGAEAGGYGADITRTFPASGRFSGRQKDLYSIVLDIQKQCIQRARAGVISADLHVHSMKLLAEGLKSLKILKGDTEGLVLSGAAGLFYPHGFGHMLGLDVHDSAGGKKRALPNTTGVPVRFVAKLEPGFVITVEPGIYFIEALLQDPVQREKHKGSVDFKRAEAFMDLGGIRIEDNVVIRKDGPPLNLTHVPKEIQDVEAACGR